MSSEWELDEGIKSIKSAWRRERTARANLEKILEQAEAENARLCELIYDRAHDHAIQHMTEDELRITLANALDENAKLHELVNKAWHCVDQSFSCYECRIVLQSVMRELGVEVK